MLTLIGNIIQFRLRYTTSGPARIATRRQMFKSGAINISASALFVLAPVAASAENVVGTPAVVDGDTLSIGDTIVRIAGIDAPETDQHCIRDNGDRWNCGKAAGTELKQAIGANPVACKGTERDRYGRLLAKCRIGRIDIGAWLVTRGLAIAYVEYEDTYIKQEAQAKRDKRGIWSGSFDTPQKHRQRKWRFAEKQAPDDRCPIKGNINRKGVRIYHVPWSRAYNTTKINTERGERWFCDEQQAIDAGWRPPRQG